MLQLHHFTAQIPANTTILSTDWFPLALAGAAHIARNGITLSHTPGCTRYKLFAYSGLLSLTIDVKSVENKHIALAVLYKAQ